MTGMIFLSTPIYLICVSLAHSWMWGAKQKPRVCK